MLTKGQQDLKMRQVVQEVAFNHGILRKVNDCNFIIKYQSKVTLKLNDNKQDFEFILNSMYADLQAALPNFKYKRRSTYGFILTGQGLGYEIRGNYYIWRDQDTSNHFLELALA